MFQTFIAVSIFIFSILLQYLRYEARRNYPNNYSRSKVSIYAFLRRLYYIFKHKEFSKATRDKYYLYNKNVIIIYCNKTDTFTIYNPKEPDIKIWISECRLYNLFYFIDLFDELLYSFSYNTTYEAIIRFFEENDVAYKTYKRSKTVKNANTNVIINTDTNKNKDIDINFASEKEIAALPGVNIITAKKVIKYRDLKGGFKNKDEFIKQLKVKEHFVEKIRDMIEIGECQETNRKDIGNEGRIVDFE